MNALIEIAEKETAINFDTEVFEKMISEKCVSRMSVWSMTMKFAGLHRKFSQ